MSPLREKDGKKLKAAAQAQKSMAKLRKLEDEMVTAKEELDKLVRPPRDCCALRVPGARGPTRCRLAADGGGG